MNSPCNLQDLMSSLITAFFQDWRKEPFNSDFLMIFVHVLSRTPVNATKKFILQRYTSHVAFFMLFSIFRVFSSLIGLNWVRFAQSVIVVCTNLIAQTKILWSLSYSWKNQQICLWILHEVSNLVGSYHRHLYIKNNREFRSKGTCDMISHAHKNKWYWKNVLGIYRSICTAQDDIWTTWIKFLTIEEENSFTMPCHCTHDIYQACQL